MSRLTVQTALYTEDNLDLEMARTLARKMGLSPEKLQRAIKNHCTGAHDSLWLDFTADTPVPFRKNGYEKINLH